MKRLCIILTVILLVCGFVACKKSASQPEMSRSEEQIQPSQTNDSGHIPTPPITNEQFKPIITNEIPEEKPPVTPPATNEIIDDIPIWKEDNIYRTHLDINYDNNTASMHQFDGLSFRWKDSTSTIYKDCWIKVKTNAQGWGYTYLCYDGGWEYELTAQPSLRQGELFTERAGKRFYITIKTDATMHITDGKYTDVYKCLVWTR